MKKNKCIVLVAAFLLSPIWMLAQQEPSPEAKAFYQKAITKINPRHVAWINTTAKLANEKNMTDADINKKAVEYGKLNGLAQTDIQAMNFLVLMQAAKSAQEDLKSIMAGVKAINDQKAALRNANNSLTNKRQEISRIQLDSIKLLLQK